MGQAVKRVGFDSGRHTTKSKASNRRDSQSAPKHHLLMSNPFAHIKS